MSFIKQHIGKIISVVCIIAILAIAFFCRGSNTPKASDNFASDKAVLSSQLQDEPVKTPEATNNAITDEAETPAINTEAEAIGNAITDEAETPVINTETEQPESTQEEEKATSAVSENSAKENIEYSKESGMKIDNKTGMDEHNTEPVPVGKPVPAEPNEAKVTDNQLTCTLSIRCDNAVGKSSEKAAVIPNDGVIFAEKSVVFYEGESVFHVLVREMKKNKIHLEFVNTPIYNSAYIEGIGNLYEFDCGELSGWMYKVNGWFPNYGCSRYELKNDDKIEWVYTCDSGKDVGGDYSARNGKQNE